MDGENKGKPELKHGMIWGGNNPYFWSATHVTYQKFNF